MSLRNHLPDWPPRVKKNHSPRIRTGSPRVRRRGRRTRRLCCEALEDRRLLATLTVETSSIGGITYPVFDTHLGKLQSAEVTVDPQSFNTSTNAVNLPFHRHLIKRTPGIFGAQPWVTWADHLMDGVPHRHGPYAINVSGPIPAQARQPGPETDPSLPPEYQSNWYIRPFSYDFTPLPESLATAEERAAADSHEHTPVEYFAVRVHYQIEGEGPTITVEFAPATFFAVEPAPEINGTRIYLPGDRLKNQLRFRLPAGWTNKGFSIPHVFHEPISDPDNWPPAQTYTEESDFGSPNHNHWAGAAIAPYLFTGYTSTVTLNPEIPHKHSIDWGAKTVTFDTASALERFLGDRPFFQPLDQDKITLHESLYHEHSIYANQVPFAAMTTFTFDPLPVADPGGPYFATVGVPTRFQAGKGGSNAIVVKFEWDWDYDDAPAFDKGITGAAPTVVFSEPYSGPLYLRVTDNSGQTAMASTRLIVTATGAPGVQLRNDPHEAMTTLEIAGTDGNDRLVVRQIGNRWFVHANFTEPRQQYFDQSDTGTVLIDLKGGNDVALVRTEKDTVGGTTVTAIVRGGDGNDFLKVSVDKSVILGGSGNDHLLGARGDDLIRGGDGNDVVWGFAGDDTLEGGEGHDIVLGGPGNDLMHAGSGNDLILGGYGDDILVGGAGLDLLFGNAGNDVMIGGADRDLLVGHGGQDIVIGGSTLHDDSHLALRAIGDYWADMETDVRDRISALTGANLTVAGVLPLRFLLTQVGAATVFDDGARDRLFGNSGTDWYWARRGEDLLGEYDDLLEWLI